MAKQDAVIRLLLVEDQLEDAEQTISLLRNGGIAIRPQRPDSEEELVALLQVQNIDIVIAGLNCSYLPFPNVIQRISTTGKDIPVLAMVDILNEENILAAIAAGARDVVLRARAEHLQFVIRNEFLWLDARRALRLLELSLRETERRCDALISSSRDPIAYVHQGMHIRANEAYLEMFGYDSFQDIEGLSLLDLIAPQEVDAFKLLLKTLMKGETPSLQIQTQAQRADGSSFAAVMESTQATYEGEPCLQIVFRQQTLDAAMVKELDMLRQRDQATGLFNRKYFMAATEAAVAKAATGHGHQALLLIEPDNYAHIVKEIGLVSTDELLTKFSAHLLTAMGPNTECARFGEHTFAVLCAEHDYKKSQQQAERIRTTIEGHIFEVGERSISFTVSIGGVQIGEKIASVTEVLGKANHCLHSAAGVGGNRIEIFDPAARDRAEEERIEAWLQRIREALAGDEFVLYYQPVISLSGSGDDTYEVYVRMKGKSGEIVLPNMVLPIAEEHGLLEDIDRWVLGRAIEVLAERKSAKKPITLFVKITPTSLAKGDLSSFIAIQLKTYELSGENLVLQLPESKIHTHLRAVQTFQKAMSALGVRIAIEQFGNGLNSFQMLTHFDPAVLKIDRTFIVDLAKNTEHQEEVRTIVEEAHRLGKTTIAEFVSDAATMSVLFTIGVDYVEGNFLAPAAPMMNYDFS